MERRRWAGIPSPHGSNCWILEVGKKLETVTFGRLVACPYPFTEAGHPISFDRIDVLYEYDSSYNDVGYIDIKLANFETGQHDDIDDPDGIYAVREMIRDMTGEATAQGDPDTWRASRCCCSRAAGIA